MKKHLSVKILLLLILIDLVETFAQFCFKKSALSADTLDVHSLAQGVFFVKTLLVSPFLWFGLISVLFIFISWSTILSKIDLSVAVPVASFSYITIPVVSMLIFHEHISLLRWAGIGFILVGVILVSLSSRRKEQAT